MIRRSIVFAILGCILTSCNNSPTEPQASANFPGKVAVIIQANCLGGSCHSGATTENDGLDLTSWETLVKGSKTLNEIIPFDPVSSHLFEHINTNPSIAPRASPAMPLARNPLSSGDQQTIFDWIKDGAKSANGEIAYSNTDHRLFVTSQGADLVAVLDADTRRIIRTIRFSESSFPTSIARLGESIIVGFTSSGGTIKKYNIKTLALEGEFSSGVFPERITISPDGKKGYIAVEGSAFVNRIGVFDPVAMKMIKIINTPFIKSSANTIFTADAKYAYICGAESDNIIKLDTQNDSIVANIPFSKDVPIPPTDGYTGIYTPVAMALSPDEKTLYVTSINNQRVFLFDLSTNTTTSNIKVGVFPRDIRLTPDGKELWVTNSGKNTISIIDCASSTVTMTIDSVGSEPFMISFTPDGARAFIACHSKVGAGHHSQDGPPPSSVVVIDVATRAILQVIEMPTYSAGIVMGF